MRNEISASRALEAFLLGALDSGTSLVLDGSLVEHLGHVVDQEQCTSRSAEDYLRDAFTSEQPELLDFGCGTAGHRPMLEHIGYNWRGINYRGGMAPGAAVSAASDPSIEFYDGLYLPYEDQTFDVVYSYLTFQCLQRIDISFSELKRVLKPGGRLIGSVGYMEQMQDYTAYNYTPYGFKFSCDQAGLNLTNISAGNDIFTYIFRRLFVVTSGSDENSLTSTLFAENTIGKSFVAYGSRLGLSARDVNLLRLQFSTNFNFEARRMS